MQSHAKLRTGRDNNWHKKAYINTGFKGCSDKSRTVRNEDKKKEKTGYKYERKKCVSYKL